MNAASSAAGAVGSSLCRGCGAPPDRLRPIIDFGRHPHASSFPLPSEAGDLEPRWPLVVALCETCLLVQLAGEVPEEPALVGAAPWTTAAALEDQARGLVEMCQRIGRSAGSGAAILEVASHGNYLQPLFREVGARSIIVERTPLLARHAVEDGADVIEGDIADPASVTASAGPVALYVDHYALAHHPAPDRALAGVAALLAPGGAAIYEFDSLLPSLATGEFDGFRHGHFAYWSLVSFASSVARHGLVATDVTEHPTYGGVLRVVVRRKADGAAAGPSVLRILAAEQAAGLEGVTAYGRFESAIKTTCSELRRLVDAELANGGRAAAYGAPSRGNTLLNTCGIGADRLEFTVDRAAWKHGRVLPGSRIPILAPEALRDGVSLVVILTWDIATEVARDLRRELGSRPRLAVPFPRVGLIETGSSAATS